VLAVGGRSRYCTEDSQMTVHVFRLLIILLAAIGIGQLIVVLCIVLAAEWRRFMRKLHPAPLAHADGTTGLRDRHPHSCANTKITPNEGFRLEMTAFDCRGSD
jgi:hypothetical protein